jgi:EmrB/QacA subfamily drug resistance transporter
MTDGGLDGSLGPKPPARPAPYAVLGVVAVGTFMSALGGSLINVAVPMIRADYRVDMSLASWVLAAYSLSVSALLLPAGRVGDLFGKRRVYGAGFVIFGAASAAAAMAPSLFALVAARAVQGTGAAMLMATGPALTTAAFPPEKRGRALGMQATATYVGLTVGPSIGGLLAYRHGWHLAFWVNVPIAAVGAALSRLALHPERHNAPPPFPWRSAALLGPALAALSVGLTRGPSWGWSSPIVVGLLGAGAVLFAGFLAAEQCSRGPLVSAALLRQAGIVGGVAAAFLQYAAAYMMAFLMPFYLEGPLGMTAEQAGAMMTVQPATMAVTTGASGWLSDRMGTRAPAVLGMGVLATALARVALLGAAPSRGELALALAFAGLGAGLFTSPNNSSIMGAAPRERQGTAAGLLAEARNTGMLAGIAAAGTLFAAFGGGRPGEVGGAAFGPAFRGTLLVAAGVAAGGAVVSALRGRAEDVKAWR